MSLDKEFWDRVAEEMEREEYAAEIRREEKRKNAKKPTWKEMMDEERRMEREFNENWYVSRVRWFNNVIWVVLTHLTPNLKGYEPDEE